LCIIVVVIDRREINQRFGKRLALYRKRAGLSQERLAEALSLTRTSITNIEHGRQPIQLPTLYAIADALGVEPTDLMPSPPKASVEGPIDGEQLKGLSVKTTNWLARVSGDMPAKQTENTNGES
jgi:transcriptional regulator with XRE-family HTH domain